MSNRIRLLAIGAAAATALTLAPAAQSAAADPVPDATAYASADYVTSGSIKPEFYVGGALGALLQPITQPVLDGFVNPLMAAAANLPRKLAEYLAGLVNDNGLTASNPVPTNDPDSALDGCDNSLLGASQANPYCYQMFQLPTGNLPIGVHWAQTSGWTVSDQSKLSKPVVGKAQTSDWALTMFGFPLIQSGNAVATVSCPTVNTGEKPTSSAELRNFQVLNGLLEVGTANTAEGWSQVFFNGQAVNSVTSWMTGDFQGSPVAAKLYGNGVWLKLGLTPYQLFDGLGLSFVSGTMGTILPGAEVVLQWFMGPGDLSSDDGDASAWGTNWGFDLSANIEIGIRGLATIGFKIPSEIVDTGGVPTGGNLLGMKISYAACGVNVQKPPNQVPPGVN